jgi:hypothetical protein
LFRLPLKVFAPPLALLFCAMSIGGRNVRGNDARMRGDREKMVFM